MASWQSKLASVWRRLCRLCFSIGCWLIQKAERLLQPWVTEASFGCPGKEDFPESQHYLLLWKSHLLKHSLSLPTHAHWARQGSSWNTMAMLRYAASAWELKQVWGSQSPSFPPAVTKRAKIWVMILLVPHDLLLIKIVDCWSVFKRIYLQI